MSSVAETSSDRVATSVQVMGLGGVLAVGATLAFTSLRLPLLCPLRALTGVPCPLCGMTTGTVATMRGQLGAALSANPFSLAVVPAAIGGLVVKFKSMMRRPFELRLGARGKRIAWGVAGVMAATSWVFQLFRFGLVG